MSDDLPESKAQPIWHVAVLFTFTMSAYGIVWFYKNWRDLSAQAAPMASLNIGDDTVQYFTKGNSLARAAGTLIPLLQLYLTTTFFSATASLNADNSPVRKNAWLVGALMTAAMVGFFCLAKLPGAWRLLYLLAVIPLLVAQRWINSYWHSQEPTGTIVRQAFSTGELVALILGAVLFGLNVTQAMVE